MAQEMTQQDLDNISIMQWDVRDQKYIKGLTPLSGLELVLSDHYEALRGDIGKAADQDLKIRIADKLIEAEIPDQSIEEKYLQARMRLDNDYKDVKAQLHINCAEAEGLDPDEQDVARVESVKEMQDELTTIHSGDISNEDVSRTCLTNNDISTLSKEIDVENDMKRRQIYNLGLHPDKRSVLLDKIEENYDVASKRLADFGLDHNLEIDQTTEELGGINPDDFSRFKPHTGKDTYKDFETREAEYEQTLAEIQAQKDLDGTSREDMAQEMTQEDLDKISTFSDRIKNMKYDSEQTNAEARNGIELKIFDEYHYMRKQLDESAASDLKIRIANMNIGEKAPEQPIEVKYSQAREKLDNEREDLVAQLNVDYAIAEGGEPDIAIDASTRVDEMKEPDATRSEQMKVMLQKVADGDIDPHCLPKATREEIYAQQRAQNTGEPVADILAERAEELTEIKNRIQDDDLSLDERD